MNSTAKTKVMLTTDVTKATGYSAKSLYDFAARGIARPQTTASGVRIWSLADVEAIKAHREKMRPKRLARLYSDLARCDAIDEPEND